MPDLAIDDAASFAVVLGFGFVLGWLTAVGWGSTREGGR